MPFVSCAQNYVDVILWHALRDLERGFSVDGGAATPRSFPLPKLTTSEARPVST
jgi:hypothetical protein